MRLTKKLLGFLNHVFDKDPAPFLALRLSYDGRMTWRIADAVLTTSVSGGSGSGLSVDLTQHTIASLVVALSQQQGYTVLYADGTELLSLSARVLLDGSGDIDRSNGDHLYGYTNVLFSYMEAQANELALAEKQIVEMVHQMSTKTAADMWVDELGGYYGVPRLVGELDASYGPRIIAEVLRPRENNVAMEKAIGDFTGQKVTVTDVIEWGEVQPRYNGAATHNAARNHDAQVPPVYGLFDVSLGYDLLNGGSIPEFSTTIASLIDRLRAAGTHMRAFNLTASTLADELVDQPTDGGPGLALTLGVSLEDAHPGATESDLDLAVGVFLEDTLPTVNEASNASYSFNYRYSGKRYYDGKIRHYGGMTFDNGTLEDEGQSSTQQVSEGSMNALHYTVANDLPAI